MFQIWNDYFSLSLLHFITYIDYQYFKNIFCSYIYLFYICRIK